MAWTDSVPTAANQISNDLTNMRNNFSHLKSIIDNFCVWDGTTPGNIFPVATKRATVTGTSSMSNGDVIIEIDPGAATTYTLLAAATAGAGYLCLIKSIDLDYGIIIDGSGSETIDGDTNFVFSVAKESLLLYCDGSNWHILGHRKPRPTRRALSNETYSETKYDDILECSGASGAVTVNLRAAATAGAGRRLTIIATDVTNTITVDPNASETIARPGGTQTTYVFFVKGQSIEIESNGSNWVIVSEYIPTQIATGTTSGTGEDVIATFTFPANSLRIGDVLEADVNIDYQNANGNKTLKYYFGATNITIRDVATPAYDSVHRITTYLSATNSHKTVSLGVNTNNTAFCVLGSGSDDITSGSITVKITGECANSADTIVCNYISLVVRRA
jgi:hypothetical protein